jgi:hypothetical protein
MKQLDKKTSKMMMEIQLNNICNILGGTWHRQSVLNSMGERTERIIITYPSPEEDSPENV